MRALRGPIVIYDFETDPFWISLYMRKMVFSFFFSVRHLGTHASFFTLPFFLCNLRTPPARFSTISFSLYLLEIQERYNSSLLPQSFMKSRKVSSPPFFFRHLETHVSPLSPKAIL